MGNEKDELEVPAPPMWVKMGLWGLADRASVWAFFWACIALSVASLVVGLLEPLFLFGLLFLVAAYWYWAALRWVDKHGMWPRKEANCKN